MVHLSVLNQELQCCNGIFWEVLWIQHKAWPGTDHRLVRGSEVRRIEEDEEKLSRDEYKERFTHGKRFRRTMPAMCALVFGGTYRED